MISIIREKKPRINKIGIHSAELHIIRSPDSSYFNMDLFVIRLKQMLIRDPKKRKHFYIDRLVINESTLSLNDQQSDLIKGRFDHRHFTIDSLRADFRDLHLIKDTIEMNVVQLSGYDRKTQLHLKDMKSNFRFSNRGLEFRDLSLSFGNSLISDSIIFTYTDKSNLKYFIDSVHIAASLKNTILHSEDLALFAPALKRYGDVYDFSGTYRGKISRFSVDDFTLKFGRRSKLSGDISFNGLPNWAETFIEFNLQPSQLEVNDLGKYLDSAKFNLIGRFGRVNMKGQFLGFPSDFVADGAFDTPLGRVVSDINLKISSDPTQSTYRGNLTLIDFDAGTLLDRPDLFQEVQMKGNIDGRGLTISTADFFLNADFEKLGFRNYDYTQISTSARMARELFEGELEINDPNLKFHTEAIVDLRNNTNKIKLQGDLEIAFLKNLNLTEKKVSLSSVFDVDIQGLQLDSITGIAKFKNIFTTLEDRSLYIDSVSLVSRRRDNYRWINWNSDRIDVSIQGDYHLSELGEYFREQFQEYKLIFLNNEKELEDYYASV